MYTVPCTTPVVTEIEIYFAQNRDKLYYIQLQLPLENS